MKSHLIRPLSAAALAALCLASAGCANRSRPLYEWGSYQQQVYEHFKSTSTGPEEQLIALQKDLEEIRSDGMSPPPGFYAHMGMLYASIGQDDKAMQAFDNEKSLFPESAKYLDFLMSKAKNKK
ncbi:MAG TPA: DUF4810 domain-containing protein [Aquabacterium sp.]|nr:DUF4810 domain-containing protein [Aquabacterium sp.]